MKRSIIILALSFAAAAPAQVFVRTNDVLALDPLQHPQAWQVGAPMRYTIFPVSSGAPMTVSGLTGQLAVVDLADGVTVAQYYGGPVDDTTFRFSGTVGQQLRVGSAYRGVGSVYLNGTLVAQISSDNISISEAYCSTCRTVVAVGGSGGSSSGPFTGPGSTGTVTAAASDTNKFLRGDGQWRAISTPVEVWSNGVSLGVVNGLQISTGLGVRVVTDGTSTLAQIYPTVTSGQGSSIPGSTQLAAFAYTGSTQTYVVASGMTQIMAKIWGGAVAASGSDAGYTVVTFPVTPLETLHLVVGQGTSRTNTTPGVRPFGGAGYLFTTNVGGTANLPGGSGSFIFRDSAGTQALIACAGGAGYASDGGGETAQNNALGSPASQTNGGVASTKTTNTDGSYLLGGLAATNGGSAGGSGYYGGYGSHTNNTGSGGGSGTIQSGYGITVRSNYSFDDNYPGQPANYAAPVATGSASGGGHGYIILKGFVAP